MIFGIDWASDHHDVALTGPDGRKLERRRIADDAAGLGELIALFAAHEAGPATVRVAIGRTGELGAALEHLAAAALILGRRHGMEHTSWWARINVLTRGPLLTMAPAG